MMKRLTFAVLLFSGFAFSQGVRIGDDVPVTKLVQVQGTNFKAAVTGATLSVCNAPANGVPCTNKATTYTDSTLGSACSTSTQITLVGTAACIANPDQYGNWGAWVGLGQYEYTITTPSGSFGPFPVSAPATVGSSPAFVNETVTGTLTAGAIVSGPLSVGGYLKAGAGPWVDPLYFGADPTNTLDSTAAINSALTEACTLSNGFIQFSPGTYKITSTITVACRVRWECAGAAGACVLKKAAGFTGPGVLLPPAAGAGASIIGSIVQGMMVDADAAAAGDGWQITGNSIVMIADIAVNQPSGGNGFRIGQDAVGSINANSFLGIGLRALSNNGSGYLWQDTSGGSNANAGACIGCWAQSNHVDGLTLGVGTINNTFSGFTGEVNGSGGVGACIHQKSGSQRINVYGGDCNESNAQGPLVIDSGANTTGGSYVALDTGGNYTDNGTYKTEVVSSAFGHHGFSAGGTSATPEEDIAIVNTSGHARCVLMETNPGGGLVPTARWRICANATGESGANSGSDLIVQAYDDAGTSLGAAITCTRSTLGCAFGNGLTTSGVISTGSNPSSTGFIRLLNASVIAWRNNANSGDVSVAKDTSDRLTFNSQIVNDGAHANGLTIASGTAAMTTAPIASGACGSTVTVAGTGVLATDAIETSWNASVAANPGVLILQKWPTSGNVNFAYCNPTAGSVTPTASTLNWRVGR